MAKSFAIVLTTTLLLCSQCNATSRIDFRNEMVAMVTDVKNEIANLKDTIKNDIMNDLNKDLTPEIDDEFQDLHLESVVMKIVLGRRGLERAGDKTDNELNNESDYETVTNV
jgi:hypothetical protein